MSRYFEDQESKLAKRVGGKKTPGSGNKTVKGDIRVVGKIRIECKSTEKDSFSIKKEYFKALQSHSFSYGEEFLMNIDFIVEGKKTLGLVVLSDSRLDEVMTLLNGA